MRKRIGGFLKITSASPTLLVTSKLVMYFLRDVNNNEMLKDNDNNNNVSI